MTDYFSVWKAGDWILYALGVAITSVQQRLIMATWVQAEGGQVETSTAGGPAYNPLNTTLTTHGGVHGEVSGAPGIPAFADLYYGALAAAGTIREAAYAEVLNAIRNGDLAAFSSALVRSPWASGHYGGNLSYFVTLSRNVPQPPPPLSVPTAADIHGGAVPTMGPTNTGAPFVAIPAPGAVPPPPNIGAAWGQLRDAIARTMPAAANVVDSTKQRIIDATKLGGY